MPRWCARTAHRVSRYVTRARRGTSRCRRPAPTDVSPGADGAVKRTDAEDGRDLHDISGAGGGHHHAVADVDADVAEVVGEDEIARAQVVPCHLRERVPLT